MTESRVAGRARRASRKPDEEPAAEASTSTAPHGQAGRLLTAILSQTTVLTAVLFYFGWSTTNGLYGYFGVDTSVLELSVSDYLLRSIRLAYPSLFLLGVFALFALFAHRTIRQEAGDDLARLRRIRRAVASAGVLATITGLAGAAITEGRSGSVPLWSFLLLTIGFGAVAYSAYLSLWTPERSATPWIGMVLVLAFVSLFGAVGSYGQYVGRRAAVEIAQGSVQTDTVIVYSVQNLGLTGPGVTATSLTAAQGLYRYRYAGLRLLVRAGGNYLLLPAAWRPGDGAVIALPDSAGSGSLLLEFAH